MKKISEDESFAISQAVRSVLNQVEGTKGCDAILLCFAGDVDGMKLAHIKINKPPDIHETIGHLISYLAMHAYDLGVQDGQEKERHNIKSNLQDLS